MSTATNLPTTSDIAAALGYVSHEFDLSKTDNIISGELWAEGLAFSRYAAPECMREAQQHQTQLTEAQWRIIKDRADHMAACDGFAGFDVIKGL